MSKYLTVLSAILLFAITSFSRVENAEAKPFRKALVIGGGGITPGVALGIIAGAEAAGYKPDVIIASCGSSLGAGLYSSFADAKQALRFAKSAEFHASISRLAKIDSWYVLGLKVKLDRVLAQPDAIPAVFKNNILNIPERIENILPVEKFPSGKDQAKLIVIGSQAFYGPEYQGRKFGPGSLIREVYFTDPKTAELLEDRTSSVQKIFPHSRVSPHGLTSSSVSISQATRVSITDPFYINPAKIGNNYYFGGAVDLFPIETALDLADEVLVNFPAGLYNTYEDLAISSVFGFAQSDRVIEAAKHTNVKWIDTSGTQDLAMDPSMQGLVFVNRIPSDVKRFASLIEKQYRFGYERGFEAAKLQQTQNNVRSHLRSTTVGAK